jgi:Domain of unknown function (DUF4157)/Pretoxin HINT domain
MADSHSTANPEAAKATSTAQPPVQDVNVTGEIESEEVGAAGDRIVRGLGGGSPEVPPSQFAVALGKLGSASQVEMLRGLQRSYGNNYVGQVIQRKCEECKKEEIQRQGEGNISAIPEGFESAMQRSAGNPLDGETRSFMESRFGEDFSDVEVHTDSAAADAAKLVQAQAFTAGRGIYFGRGRYQPQAMEGKKLLAHELTHVVQQQETATSAMMKPVLDSPNNSLEDEANTIAEEVVNGKEISSTAISSTDDNQIQRLSLEDVADAGIATLLPIPTLVGELVGVDVPGAVREGLVSAGEFAVDVVTSSATAAWECAQLTGRSIYNIITFDFTLSDLLGIEKPQGGSLETLDVILAIIHHPCLRIIPGYSQLLKAVAKLEEFKSFLKGAWQVMQDPSQLIEAIKTSFGIYITQVPIRAYTLTKNAITFSEPLQEHLDGIWRHLGPKLDDLANNWWTVLKEAGWDLLWPWPGVWEDLQAIWSHLGDAVSNLWDLEFSDAIDDLLASLRYTNSALGRLAGWFFIASVLVGAVLGAIFGGGAGAIPGAVAGAKVGIGFGEFLLVPFVAVESASIAKAGYDLVFAEQTDDEQEEDYEQIANSGLALAIAGALFFIGAIAARFARGVITRVRGMFRARPRVAAEPTIAPRVPRREAPVAESPRPPSTPEPPPVVERPRPPSTPEAPIEGTPPREAPPPESPAQSRQEPVETTPVEEPRRSAAESPEVLAIRTRLRSRIDSLKQHAFETLRQAQRLPETNPNRADLTRRAADLRQEATALEELTLEATTLDELSILEADLNSVETNLRAIEGEILQPPQATRSQELPEAVETRPPQETPRVEEPQVSDLPETTEPPVAEPPRTRTLDEVLSELRQMSPEEAAARLEQMRSLNSRNLQQLREQINRLELEIRRLGNQRATTRGATRDRLQQGINRLARQRDTLIEQRTALQRESDILNREARRLSNILNPQRRTELPCFSGDTLVHTVNGSKRIDNLQRGENIFAFDFAIGSLVKKEILDITRNKTLRFYEIKIENDTINSSGSHRFWVENKSQWIAARELEVGMQLKLLNGENIAITAIVKKENIEADTYNLTINEIPNYFVGLGVLVHNNGPVVYEFGNFIVYEAVNPNFPDKIYIGQTERDVLTRQGEHRTRARQMLENPSELTPADREFYQFMQDAELKPRARGLDGVQAEYLEQTNIDIEVEVRGSDNVINRKAQVSPERMRELRRQIAEDSRVRDAGYCP